MYSDIFCKVYNELGWNYYPEAFAQQLLDFLRKSGSQVTSCLDLGCGTGVLCRILKDNGIDAAGMDLSPGMIAIAREANPDIPFEAADMITYLPQRCFDLVTCTGDALNHIMDPGDVKTIFRNVYNYLTPGGMFLFDILNEKEVSTEEPFSFPFNETITAQFQVTRPDPVRIDLNVQIFENGTRTVDEHILEILHDTGVIRSLLEQVGFRVESVDHCLPLTEQNQASTWYILAKKT